MGCTESDFEQFAIMSVEDFEPEDSDTDEANLPEISINNKSRPEISLMNASRPEISLMNASRPERRISQEAPNSAKNNGVAKNFWVARNQATVETKKKGKRKRKTMSKKKKTEWKYDKVKPEVIPLSKSANSAKPPTVRDGLGKLLSHIDGLDDRAILLEEAHLEDELKLIGDVRAMRMKRELTMRKLNPEDFKAAQEAVSQALLKRPEDYEFANAEDTEALMQAVNVIFRDKSSVTLTGTKKEKFVNLLHKAGVLRSIDEKDKSEVKKQVLLNQIDMNASPFIHSAGDLVRDTFVSAICELIEREPIFEVVKFSYGALKESHILELAASLEKCKNLKHVYLDSNDFGNKGIRALIKVLLVNKETLITLSIQNLPSWQTPSTQVLEEFVEAIESSSALVRLGFDMKEFRHQNYMDRVSKKLQKNFERLREERFLEKLKPAGVEV